MRRVGVKILLGFLIVTLIAPTVLFTRPKKAEALISLAQCIAAKVTALGVAAGPIAAQSIAAVMTISPAEAAIAAQTSAGQDWVSCFMKALVKIIAKTLLHTFVQSIVNWINSGFQGSPSFVTNPEGFFADVADQTIGRVLENISPLLCSPFRLDIRFALGLNLSLNTEDEIHCRLSDVIANVRGAYDGFVTGTIGSGNLSRWIHIAGTPQNNPYGAYIATTNRLAVSITNAQGQQRELLNWGKGFRSWRSCKGRAPGIKNADGTVRRKGACIEEGPIKTPGSIIQDQTSGALRTTFEELEVADEIDEIIGALINQLLVKAITGAGGLLGASKGSITSGGRSAASALLTDTKKALAITDAKTPEGIDCRLRYYPATKETATGSGIYVPDNSLNTVYTDNLGAGKTVGVVEGDLRSYVPAKYKLVDKEGDENDVIADVEKNTGQTWSAYFYAVRLGCSNYWNPLIAEATDRGLKKYEEDTTRKKCNEAEANPKTCIQPQEPPTIPKIPQDSRKIPIWEGNAALNQSHIEYSNGLRGPENAAGGFGLSDTNGSTKGHWWTASLKKTEKIKVMVVRTYKDSESYAPSSIKLALLAAPTTGVPITPDDVIGTGSDDKPLTVWSNPPGGGGATVTGWPANVIITFKTPIEANAVVIERGTRLILTSVKLYRPAEDVTSEDIPVPGSLPPDPDPGALPVL